MQAKIIHGNKSTINNLIKESKQAYRNGLYRYSIRLNAVVLNMEGKAAPEIASIIRVHRVNVLIWLKNYEQYGTDGLLEGQRSGRPNELSNNQLEELSDIIESGPVAYGFTSGLWTSPMIARVIEDEYSVSYSPSHITRILHKLGFTVQRPKRIFIQADPKVQYIWVKDKYPSIKKKHKGKKL